MTLPNPRALHRTLYSSRSLIDPDRLADEVDRIIRCSIINNRADGITGLLFIHQGWFVQALEGPADAVEAVLDRIARDSRNEALRIIDAGHADGRLFSDWDMCARTLSDLDAEVIDAFEYGGPFDAAGLTPTTALRLLTTLRTLRADIAGRFRPTPAISPCAAGRG